MDLATLHVRIDSESARGELEKLRRKTKQVQNEARGRGKRTGAPATQKAAKGMQKQADSATKLRRELNRVDQLELSNLSPRQLKKTGSAIESLSTSMNRMYRQGKISLEQYNKLDAELGNLRTKYDKYTGSVNKNNESKKKHLSILDDLWRSFDRGTGMILRQVQLWGLLSAVLVGAQAAYAGIAVVATRAGSTLRENAHQLNMSVQALQELQFAATSVGMSVRDLRDGLGELSTSIVDAVKGQASAKEAFEDLGISLSTLINEGNNTNAMFDKVMAKLRETDSAAKRLSIAQDIFGETAGRQALKFIGRMEQARQVVDQFHGALSDKLAKSAAETWNRFRLLWTVLKGQFIQAAAEATGTINKFADQLLKAAKRGNLFKQTLVPAIENTTAVIKALIPIVQNLYRFINFLAQNFWYVEQAGKALIGLGLVKVFNRLTGAISAASSATGVLNRALVALGATIKSVLRFTGYYLLFEGIMRIIGAVRHLNKIVSTSELTFEMAARAAMENFINNTIDGLETFWDYIQSAMEKIVNYIPDMMGKAGTDAWEALKKGFQGEGEAPTGSSWITPGVTSALKGASRLVSSALGGRSERLDYTEEEEQFSNWLRSRFRQAGGGQQGGGSDLFKDGGVDLTPEGKMEEYKKALKEISESFDEDIDLNIPELRDMESLPDKLDTSTLLRHFEDINSEFGSFYDKFKTAAEEGRGSKVRELIPLASKEVQVNVDKTREKLERTREVLDTLKSMPPGVGPSPDELREAELKVTKMEKQYESLIDKQKELRTTQMALGRGIGPSGKSQIEDEKPEGLDLELNIDDESINKIKAMTDEMENFVEMTKAENATLNDQATAYSNLFGTMKKGFDAGSEARKRMHDLEMAFATAEIALETKKAVTKGVTAVTNAMSSGDPYTAVARAAAVAATVASALSQIGASFSIGGGGGGGSESAFKTGEEAWGAGGKSESFSESRDMLQEYNELQYDELIGIRKEMEDLNQNITGVARSFTRMTGPVSKGKGFSIDTTSMWEDFASKSWSDNVISPLSSTVEDITGSEIAGAIAGIGAFELPGDFVSNMIGELGSSMFGGGKKIKQAGLKIGDITIEQLQEGVDASVQQYAKIKEEGGWFSSSSTETKTRGAGEAVTNQINNMLQGMGDTLLTLADKLGVATSKVEGYTFDLERLDLKGKTGEERREAISNWMSNAMDAAFGDIMGDFLNKYRKQGEDFLKTATRLVTGVSVVETALDKSGQEFNKTGKEAVEFSQDLIKAAGGMEELDEGVSTFFDAVKTDAEKLEFARGNLETLFRQIEALSADQIPQNTNQWENLVESLDLTTNKGREAYAALMTNADAIDNYVSKLEKQKQTIASARIDITQAVGEEVGLDMFKKSIGITRDLGVDQYFGETSRSDLESGFDQLTELYQEGALDKSEYESMTDRLIEKFEEWKQELKQSQDQVVVVKVGEEDFKTYIQEEADAVRVEAERRQVGDTPIFG